MAVDISKNANHVIAFPSFIASMMGQYGHVINLEMQANADNGSLFKKGSYIKFEQYEADDVTDDDVVGVIREASSEGGWYVEITTLPAYQVFWAYNTPESPYPEKELRDEALFYNAAGDITQGGELHVGDIFSLSAAAFTGVIAEGKAVKYAGGKYVIQ